MTDLQKVFDHSAPSNIIPKIKIYGRERCQMLWVLFNWNETTSKCK